MGWDIRTKVAGADTFNPERLGVNVYTNEGRFVAYLPVLPFAIPPQVITWGSRSFVLTAVNPKDVNKDYVFYQYREGFNYACPLFWDAYKETWVNPTSLENFMQTYLGEFTPCPECKGAMQHLPGCSLQDGILGITSNPSAAFEDNVKSITRLTPITGEIEKDMQAGDFVSCKCLNGKHDLFCHNYLEPLALDTEEFRGEDYPTK